MCQLPSDPVKRRTHEQSVVPWINEKDVRLCPGCANSFGMTRRKHHCRLCGGVMCSDCSDLVSFELAERLINPATISKFKTADNSLTSSPSRMTKAQATYDGLVSNLVDLAGFAESQRNFRSCLLCKEVLDKRDSRISLISAPDPDLVRYYQHLQKLLGQGEQMSSKYRQMAESLNNGESAYQIEEAKILRLQVLKAAETVDAVSKKIAELPEINRLDNFPESSS
jgi:rabenosyn-5